MGDFDRPKLEVHLRPDDGERPRLAAAIAGTVRELEMVAESIAAA